ncbi:hypothetical protein AX769_18025 [Frondihabitans sp. PAMC 28766]|nr:hypothetical protein AX769_18025 [Frondihabitans sp. PAMC 28766]
MVNWITSFSNQVFAETGRYPAIYSTTDWWSKCTGNSSAFGHNPLFIAHYGPALSAGPGTLPKSWSSWTIWQYADAGAFPGDQDVINGGSTALAGLAVPASLQSPKGSVDEVSTVPGGIEVRGWAIDPNSTGSIGVAVYLGAKGYNLKANLSRPDVATQYPADGALHGFDAVIPAAEGAYKVCVYGINVGAGSNDLLSQCGTGTSAGSTPIGGLDSVSSTPKTVTLKGWALDGDTSSPIHVAVYVDGKGTMATANAARADVGARFPNYGSNHGFSVTLSEKQGTHSVCAYAINVGAAASNPRLGVCRTVVVNQPPIGRLDSVTVSGKTITATGWTIDEDTPTTSTRVAVYVDAAGAQVTANVSRPDVAKVYAGAGALHGYKVSLTTTSGKHRVCAYGIDTSGGSNPTLKCVTVTVK